MENSFDSSMSIDVDVDIDEMLRDQAEPTLETIREEREDKMAIPPVANSATSRQDQAANGTPVFAALPGPSSAVAIAHCTARTGSAPQPDVPRGAAHTNEVLQGVNHSKVTNSAAVISGVAPRSVVPPSSIIPAPPTTVISAPPNATLLGVVPRSTAPPGSMISTPPTAVSTVPLTTTLSGYTHLSAASMSHGNSNPGAASLAAGILAAVASHPSATQPNNVHPGGGIAGTAPPATMQPTRPTAVLPGVSSGVAATPAVVQPGVANTSAPQTNASNGVTTHPASRTQQQHHRGSHRGGYNNRGHPNRQWNKRPTTNNDGYNMRQHERRRRENQRQARAQDQLRKDAMTSSLKEWLVIHHCMRARNTAVLEDFVENLVPI